MQPSSSMFRALRAISVLSSLYIACLPAAFANADLPAVDCVIQPFDEVELGSPVAGIIQDIAVEKSDFVVAGQVVARLEDRVEQATVRLAKARSQVEAQLESEKINLVYDRKSRERIESLYGQKVISVGNKDEADREAELSRWRLEQVKDLKRIRELELARAEELVDQKVIRSPIDGFVVERYRSKGEFVEDQPLVRIAQLDPLQIEAIIPIEHFGHIHPGMVAMVQPELTSISAQMAEVIVVDRVGDAASSTFSVRLAMPNPDFEVPAGLKCELKFEHRNQTMVNSYLKPRPVVVEKPKTQPKPEMRTTTRGPFKSRAAAELEREAVADALGLRPSDIGIESKEVSFIQFMVVTSDSDSKELRKKLADFDHIQLNYEDTLRYSLGVFDRVEPAQAYQLKLRQAGLNTHITERSEKSLRWAIRFTAPADSLAGYGG